MLGTGNRYDLPVPSFYILGNLGRDSYALSTDFHAFGDICDADTLHAYSKLSDIADDSTLGVEVK